MLIEGRLKLEQWSDRDTGQKRSKLKVIGESLQLLGGRDRPASAAAEHGEPGATYSNGEESPF